MIARKAILVTLTIFMCFFSELVVSNEISQAPDLKLLSQTKSRPLIAAHRGCWKGTSENSLAAITECIKLNVDIVELDVRKTKDGELILMHDESVDRTTNGYGLVKALTLADISKLRLKSADGEQDILTSLSPPTFRDAVKTARGKIIINVDAKEDIYDDVFAILEQEKMVNQVILKRKVSPISLPLALDKSFRGALVMPIVSQSEGSPNELLLNQMEGSPAAVEVLFNDLSYLKESAKILANTNILIWVNTLDGVPQISAGMVDNKALKENGEVWGQLVDKGASIIQTDEPAAIIEFFNKKRH